MMAKNVFIRKYSSKPTKVIAVAKKLYYSSVLSQNKNKQKKIWEIMQSVLPSESKNSSFFFDCFDTEKIVNTPIDPKSILNSFYKIFCTIGKNLADDIPQFDTIQHFSNYSCNRVSDLIFLKSPSATEISNIILSLNTNKENKQKCHHDQPLPGGAISLVPLWFPWWFLLFLIVYLGSL